VILLPRWCIIHLLKKAFLVIGCGTGGIYWEGAKETSYLVMHSTGTTIKKCHVSCVTFKSHTGHVSAVLVYIYLVWNQVHLPWTHKLLYKILRYTNFSRKCAQSTLKQENIVLCLVHYFTNVRIHWLWHHSWHLSCQHICFHLHLFLSYLICSQSHYFIMSSC
jgi:hypothetical protein